MGHSRTHSRICSKASPLSRFVWFTALRCWMINPCDTLLCFLLGNCVHLFEQGRRFHGALQLHQVVDWQRAAPGFCQLISSGFSVRNSISVSLDRRKHCRIPVWSSFRRWRTVGWPSLVLQFCLFTILLMINHGNNPQVKSRKLEPCLNGLFPLEYLKKSCRWILQPVALRPAASDGLDSAEPSGRW